MLKKEYYDYTFFYWQNISNIISIICIITWLFIGYKILSLVFKHERDGITILIPNFIVILIFPIWFFFKQIQIKRGSTVMLDSIIPYYPKCLVDFESLTKEEKKIPGVIGKLDYKCKNVQFDYFKQNTKLITNRSYYIIYVLLTLVLFLFAIRKGSNQQFKIIAQDNPIVKYLIQTLSVIALTTISINVFSSYSFVGIMFNQLFNNLLQMNTFLFIIIILYTLYNLVMDYFN